MGNSSSKGEFRWGDKYELIDIDSNDNLLMLMSRVSEKEYIGKQHQCSGAENIKKMQSLIDSKITKPSLYLTKLKKVVIRRSKGTCSDSKIYYLIFEKPYQSLKTECINRKIKDCRFTEDEIDCILISSVKGIEYLKDIDQPHRHISSQSIFIKEDRTIIIGDPWLNVEKTNNLNINGIIYPSPEKILYQNKLISSYNFINSALFTLGVVLLEAFTLEHMDSLYEKGFRRIKDIQIIEKINLFQSENLKRKLRILLNHQPQKRSEIFLQIKKVSHVHPQATQKTNKHFVIASKNLEDSQIITIKPQKNQQVYTIINKINQSREHSDISMSTQPRNKIHFQGTKTISFTHNNPNWYNSHQNQANFPYNDIFTTQNQQVGHRPTQQPIYISKDGNLPNFHNIGSTKPPKNTAFSLQIKNVPFTTATQQQKSESKVKQQHNFQQKMSLSSIHHNSLEESEEISNIEIIQAKKQNSIQAAAQIKQAPQYQVQNINQQGRYQKQTPQKSQNYLQQNSIHMNLYDVKKLNSTIKQLSDQSPSKDEQDSNTGYRIIQYQATGSKYDGYINNGMREGFGIFKYKDGSYYQGQWRENKMHGKGKLYYPSKKIAYDGSFYEDDFHGKGKLYNQAQSLDEVVINFENLKQFQDHWKEYQGDFFSNKKHGFGILVYRNGDKFFGNFRNDEIQGVGKYYKSDGEIISGIWSNGQLRTKE